MKHRLKYSIIMLSLLANATLFGQAPPNSLELASGKDHYRHGYNKDYPTTPVIPRENRDSVMVGAKLHYFVLPDLDFNQAYKVADDYLVTTTTKSEFQWTVPVAIGSRDSYVSPNSATSTSPHVIIEWTAVGEDTVRMVEVPKEYKGTALPAGISVCNSAEAKIPVTVINKPSVKFDQVGGAYTDGSCAAAAANYLINLPLIPTGTAGAVISEATQVEITYTLKKDGAPIGVSNPIKLTTAGGAENLSLTVTDYGVYEVTITGIADRISQKCGVTGLIGENSEVVFTYVLMPQPKAGPTYHYPNNY